MKAISKYALLFLIAASLASCGHGGGGGGVVSGEVTQVEAESIASAVGLAIDAVDDVLRAQAEGGFPAGDTKDVSLSIETSCPTAGRIRGEGVVTLMVVLEPASITAEGEVSLLTNDQSNPQNDCDASGVMLEGTLTATVSGANPAFSYQIAGTLVVARRLSDTELIVVDENCEIALSYDSGFVRGTVCELDV